MKDYSVLKAKLAEAVIAGLADDSARKDALNIKNSLIKKAISVSNIRQYLILNDKLLPLESSTDPIALAAVRALDIFDSFHIGDIAVLAKLTAILDGLTVIGVLSADGTDKAIILSMGDGMESWSDKNWSGDVTLTDITNARSYN